MSHVRKHNVILNEVDDLDLSKNFQFDVLNPLVERLKFLWFGKLTLTKKIVWKQNVKVTWISVLKQDAIKINRTIGVKFENLKTNQSH